MSFQADLSIDGGITIRLLSCRYQVQRSVDQSGRPSSRAFGGTIQVSVESTNDTFLNEWMFEAMCKQGKITFMKHDSNSKMKELSFKNGYIISLSESYESLGTNPMTIDFTISAEQITIGAATHTNNWPKQD